MAGTNRTTSVDQCSGVRRRVHGQRHARVPPHRDQASAPAMWGRNVAQVRLGEGAHHGPQPGRMEGGDGVAEAATTAAGSTPTASRGTSPANRSGGRSPSSTGLAAGDPRRHPGGAGGPGRVGGGSRLGERGGQGDGGRARAPTAATTGRRRAAAPGRARRRPRRGGPRSTTGRTRRAGRPTGRRRARPRPPP